MTSPALNALIVQHFAWTDGPELPLAARAIHELKFKSPTRIGQLLGEPLKGPSGRHAYAKALSKYLINYIKGKCSSEQADLLRAIKGPGKTIRLSLPAPPMKLMPARELVDPVTGRRLFLQHAVPTVGDGVQVNLTYTTSPKGFYEESGELEVVNDFGVEVVLPSSLALYLVPPQKRQISVEIDRVLGDVLKLLGEVLGTDEEGTLLKGLEWLIWAKCSELPDEWEEMQHRGDPARKLAAFFNNDQFTDEMAAVINAARASKTRDDTPRRR